MEKLVEETNKSNYLSSQILQLTKSVNTNVEALKTQFLNSEVVSEMKSNVAQQHFAAIEELLSPRKTMLASIKQTSSAVTSKEMTICRAEAQLPMTFTTSSNSTSIPKPRKKLINFRQCSLTKVGRFASKNSLNYQVRHDGPFSQI